MNKKVIPALLIVIAMILSIGMVAYAVYEGTPTPLSTNTVTQTSYPTTTSTTTITTTGTVTETSTIQPVEILTTTTVSGTETYTASETTTTETTSTATSTSTLSSDYYTPFYMYFTAYCPSGDTLVFCRSLTPFTLTYGSDSLTETASYTGPPSYDATATMTITQTSSTYYDLGFYYEFQNLNLGQLATGGYSITITGSGNWGVNLWLNPESFVWGPSGTPGVEQFSSVGTGAYGLGPSATTSTTISGSTSIFLVTAMGSCTSGSTETINQLVTSCGVSSSTPFALWVGVTGPSGAGTVTATIDSIYSAPYP